jgi:hypothetical protein
VEIEAEQILPPLEGVIVWHVSWNHWPRVRRTTSLCSLSRLLLQQPPFRTALNSWRLRNGAAGLSGPRHCLVGTVADTPEIPLTLRDALLPDLELPYNMSYIVKLPPSFPALRYAQLGLNVLVLGADVSSIYFLSNDNVISYGPLAWGIWTASTASPCTGMR